MIKPTKILYLPPRGIGDLVFSLPLLHSLHSALPLTEIEIPIPNRPALKQIIDLIGFIKYSDIYLPKPSEDAFANERWKAAQRGDNRAKYVAEKKIFDKYLAGRSYDLAIVAKPFKLDSINSMQVSRTDLETMGFDWKKAHMVDGFLAFANFLGILAINCFDLQFDKNSPVCLEDKTKPKIDSPYVIFNLGSSDIKKSWAPEKYVQLAKFVSSKGYTPVLVGTGNEYSDSLAIANNSPGCLNLVPQTGTSIDMQNYAILAANSSAVISGDTGLLHLADAVGTKVIGLYGPTNPTKFGPYHNLERVVSRYNVDKSIISIESSEVEDKLKTILA